MNYNLTTCSTTALFAAGLAVSLSLFSSISRAATIEIRLLETTDIHSNIMAFDYYRGESTEQFGYARVATLIHQAREEADNTILVDNGDLIQGSPMGDYVAAMGLKKGNVHPVYKAMNPMTYDVGNIGNHEFNYGLEFLYNAIEGADFPYISANVYDAKTGKHLFKPYLIKEHQFTDTSGKNQRIKVGYIGFVPPQIMTWDRKHLQDRVIAKDITETAKELVPQMRKEGAELVIAIPHSGVSQDPWRAMAENSVYYLTQIKGIDAIMFGHSHALFPSETFANLKGADLKKGTINGVPAVMPGRWGDHLGVIDLLLDNSDGEWKVVNSQSTARPVYDRANDRPLVKSDKAVISAVETEHTGTLKFVNQPIGKASDSMYSFLALVQDDPTVQIVNDAQIAYVKRYIQGDPDLDGLPVISAAAPFKAGGRKDDPNGYTEVKAGRLTYRNAADLYLYPNTLVALKIKGSELREYLEMSAGLYNQIDPASTRRQHLINWDGFRTYNFDVVEGVEYRIDVTQPARYDGSGKLINSDAHRIIGLSFNGKPIDPDQSFILATNNYRAYGGGGFAGTGEQSVVFASPDENRQILADYISRTTEQQGKVVPSATNNWQIAPIKSGVKLDVVVETSPGKGATKFIQQKAVFDMERVGLDDAGFALYRIDLTDNS